MKEQPQKPGEVDVSNANLATAINLANKNRMDWIQYAKHLEQENTALKERVAELEKQQACIVEWCELSVRHMKQFEGDQSEYDGMYQASADLLERINGAMPWPDLVLERIKEQ